MQIDPRHLEQLAVIVEAGTLQLAAERIGTSQPALSRMIGTLEARIGMPLFERSTRPLTPTALGLELSHQGRAIRTARLRAIETVDFGSRGFFGVLKLGAPPFLCRSLMSDAVASFLAARPNIRIDLTPDYRSGLMERIYRNQLDIVVGPSKFVDKGNTELVLEPLFSDRIVIVGRAGHPVMQVDAPSAGDLDGITWVGHSERSILLADMEDALRMLGVRSPRVAFQSESAQAVLELLKQSDFLTVLPNYAIKADGGDGLAIAPIELPTQPHVISAITLAERAESKLTSDFKAHLRAQATARYGA
ncbi:LysR family transcriptional regulator [Tropicimonas sediminicola]|uniref:DNA-binding transcriptional regulator, LysR family n=1 Tax=Tropicimonas sediminicola TaxID=1031541 RepID=A0A239F9M3_9RHOB|nr:LysR family transcriptional regulator [Tropicimonas sediminicola]SNS53740.1 DNA-binding transcriptional regulator, LysR family [Tropicimonas sediminicola]